MYLYLLGIWITYVFIIIADEVPKEDAAKMFAELAPPEDDDGFIPYVPFLDKLCGKA